MAPKLTVSVQPSLCAFWGIYSQHIHVIPIDSLARLIQYETNERKKKTSHNLEVCV